MLRTFQGRAISVAFKQCHDITSVYSWTFWLQKNGFSKRNIFLTYYYVAQNYILNKISASALSVLKYSSTVAIFSLDILIKHILLKKGCNAANKSDLFALNKFLAECVMQFLILNIRIYKSSIYFKLYLCAVF